MLYHHDSRNYETAAREAGDKARAKLLAIIEKGKASALDTFSTAMTRQIDDLLIKDAAVSCEVLEPGVFGFGGGGEYYPCTDYALGQICGRYGMPVKFARELVESDNVHVRNIASETLETLARQQGGGRALVRMVGDKVSAVLSDSYKRIDSRPMIESFVNASGEMGLVPVEGQVTDTRIAIKALLPEIFEPSPGEVMAFGMQLKTSDFGAGAFNCDIFVMRLWCTNNAIMESAMRKVHSGKKLDEGTFSQKTYELESNTNASALNDIVRGAFSSANVQRFVAAISAATADGGSGFNAADKIEKLVTKGSLTKTEGKAISEIYNTPDVEKLPAGNNTWRMSNAISWFAHDGAHKSNDRKLDLEKLAGDVLPKLAS